MVPGIGGECVCLSGTMLCTMLAMKVLPCMHVHSGTCSVRGAALNAIGSLNANQQSEA